jgi:gluconokinase
MLILVMGVSGSGKSTLGGALAQALGWHFLEGDALHSPQDIERMRAGVALDDEDRWPWLQRIAGWMRAQDESGQHGVIACSALKRVYRDRLREADAQLRLVYLRVPRGELERRLRQRRHFMPASLLDSQLQSLQEPDIDEAALTIDSDAAVEQQVQRVMRWIENG